MTSTLVIPPGRGHSSQLEVTRTIGTDIIVGRYPEGTPLPRDAELTAMFNVSRTALRESVKTLSAKGLLNAKAGVERGSGNARPGTCSTSTSLAGTSGQDRQAVSARSRRYCCRGAAHSPPPAAGDDAIQFCVTASIKCAFASNGIEFADADLRCI